MWARQLSEVGWGSAGGAFREEHRNSEMDKLYGSGYITLIMGGFSPPSAIRPDGDLLEHVG